MGLKITRQIGTDQGITKEAYVRISSYNIQKSGHASFQLELYMTQPEPVVLGEAYSMVMPVATCSNKEIGTIFNTVLDKAITVTRDIQIPIQKEVIVTETITTPAEVEGGEPVITTVERTEMRTVMEDSTETYEIRVPDLSILDTTSIFAYAYGKLKEKLQTSFGNTYVLDV